MFSDKSLDTVQCDLQVFTIILRLLSYHPCVANFKLLVDHVSVLQPRPQSYHRTVVFALRKTHTVTHCDDMASLVPTPFQTPLQP